MGGVCSTHRNIKNEHENVAEKSEGKKPHGRPKHR
jgi:hypothetical protein